MGGRWNDNVIIDHSGNYVYDNIVASNNNTMTENYVCNQKNLELLSKPISMGEYEIDIEKAENAYDTVLDNVGATLPKRDGINARITNDVKNSTGRVINNDEEVGGITGFEAVYKKI